MDKVEFSNLKKELTDIIVEFEFLKRKSYFLKQSYLLQFYDEIEREFDLVSENNIMLASIKELKETNSITQAKSFVNKQKEEYLIKKNNFCKNYENAKEMEKRCLEYSIEDIQALDAAFRTYCIHYHPAIKLNTTPIENDIYNGLSTIYYSGNIPAFNAFVDEAKAHLMERVINESEYDSVSILYNESLKNLKNIIANMKNTFPLAIEDIFSSDENITMQLSKLREKNYDLMQMNRQIKADYRLNFEEDFN